MQVDGGCHCGSIKYEAEVDPSKVARRAIPMMKVRRMVLPLAEAAAGEARRPASSGPCAR